jgi:hypothetical protein
LNIGCSFVEPQHTIVTKKNLPRFKYDKSKAKKYQLTLTMSFANLCVVDSIGHLEANGLTDLLQQCVGATTESTFKKKPSRRNYKERHCHKPWFDIDCCITKRELKFWLKANPNLHIAKH